MPHFFIERPIFATVVSLFVFVVGVISYFTLPVEQYPEVAPPTIAVAAAYPGANAETVAATVATPLEQEINGVEGMLYMSSYSTSDGTMQLTITFKIGTDLDKAQVLVQNRVNSALPRLPEEVRRLGVVTNKSSPNFLMVVHMLSPDDTFDQLYISNYALLKVKDQIARIDGVGEVILFGAREYALRVWLDPDRLASYGLTSSDVINAMREQNIQISGGVLGQPPTPGTNAFQLSVTTQGRFDDPEQFRNIIIKSGADGRIMRLSDVARVELGARDYVTNSYLNGKDAVAIGIFQRSGSNALATADQILERMKELSASFPKGLKYDVVYNPTEFVQQSIDAVVHTILEAIALVVFVVILFLHNWRAAIIPILAIPISLVGTFAVMAGFGFTLNMLTLFAMVLAIGIVVDDSIVVVENIERYVSEGISPKEAAHKTMDEVGAALIAIALVLSAVFIPTAFIPGVSGRFYQQFALTVSAATIISAFNSLTLSPALGAWLLRAHEPEHERTGFFRTLWSMFTHAFNRFMEGLGNAYEHTVKGLVVVRHLVLLVYVLLTCATVWLVNHVPTGFIPQLDQGYAITVLQLPDGASLTRTDEVVRRAEKIMKDVPGVSCTVAFAGFSGATFTNSSNSAAIFACFEPFEERIPKGLTAGKIIGELQGRLSVIQESFIIVVPPPPVPGIGNAGGFKLMVQDTEGIGVKPLLDETMKLMQASWAEKTFSSVFTTFSANTPQVYLNIDRTKAQMLNVPLSNVFAALQDYLGSSYVNDFNLFGRVFQVRAQADQQFRLEPENIARLKTRNTSGELVPLGTMVNVDYITGPDLVQRYNMFQSIPLTGNAAPGVSSGQALDAMEELATKVLPDGLKFEWTELALQQKMAGNSAMWVFLLSVFFVALVLAAQFESWSLPLAIILIVPMSVLSALLGVWGRGMDNNILTQIGLIVLIGLAAKNAILIVEFARQHEEHGEDTITAALTACRLRLRPILMTSMAFILGVVPLVTATGAGAEMRQAMGTAVFFGMAGVTVFGLLMTPIFYIIMRRIAQRFQRLTTRIESA